MADTSLTTRQSCANVAKVLEDLPPLVVANVFVEAAAAFNDVIYDALLAVTPEQDPNESGGMFDEPGSLKLALDSGIQLDSNLKGVRAGVGYGKQNRVAHLLEYGHRKVTHAGKTVGAVAPDPFIRKVADGGAMESAIGAFADVLVKKVPGIVS